MGSTFARWPLIPLIAPWAAIRAPSSSSLPHVFVFHLWAQPAPPSSEQHLHPTHCGVDAAPQGKCCASWLWPSYWTRIGAGKALQVGRSSNLDLGPQQRGPAAAWVVQKLRKVIPFCSELIRPHQCPVSRFGSSVTGKICSQGEFREGPGTVRAEEHLREQGLLSPGRAQWLPAPICGKVTEDMQLGPSQGCTVGGRKTIHISGKERLRVVYQEKLPYLGQVARAGCAGSILELVKPQLDTALSSLVWPGPGPVLSRPLC